MQRYDPITTPFVGNVRPPFDRNATPDQGLQEDVTEWSARVDRWKQDALYEQLPLELSSQEQEFINWVISKDTHTVGVIVRLLNGARAEGYDAGYRDGAIRKNH